jgi:hypothetical protein
VFQIGIEPNRIDILTSVDEVEFEEAWQERVVATIDGIEVPIMSVRHFIQNKHAFGRPRDLADVVTLEAELKHRDGPHE